MFHFFSAQSASRTIRNEHLICIFLRIPASPLYAVDQLLRSTAKKTTKMKGCFLMLSIAAVMTFVLTTALSSAAGAWLVSEQLRADQLKCIIALVLLAVALKTAWSLL